jgi:hypothetical protein
MLSSILREVPVGTNLALFHLLWTLLSGRLLASRGALIPALADFGLPAPAVRRAWAALADGDWDGDTLLARWRALVLAAGRWQPRCHGGYRPVAADLVGFFRPRLQGCPTTHYSSQAGKALPAIPFGMLARIGAVGEQRLPLPVCLRRADPADPREATLQAQLVQAAGAELAEDEVLVVDGGFSPTLLLASGLPRFVVRVAKNFTARRATLPERKRGRPPKWGEVVRPSPASTRGSRSPPLRQIGRSPSSWTGFWSGSDTGRTWCSPTPSRAPPPLPAWRSTIPAMPSRCWSSARWRPRERLSSRSTRIAGRWSSGR